jgi:CRP-like cAMP-binding protein
MHRGIPSCAAGVPVFKMLPASELVKLGAAMEHRDYRKGEIVAASGYPLDHLIVVAHGRLNLVYSTASGREQTVRSLGPGEFLGEMALFYDAVLEGDVIAAEDSAVCVLPRKAVKEVLNHPAALLRLVEEMARRLSQAEQLIADIGLKEVGQRLAAELVRLAQASPGNLSITVPMPWSQLAARLGTTPETLSRRLGSLADQGIIRQTGGRTVLILDLERLRKIAAG